MFQALSRRATGLGWILAACTLMGACSSSSGQRDLTPSVGLGSAITITSASGSAVVGEGQTLTLTAIVANDTNGAGVSWSLSGLGSLSGVTASSVTYNAPAVGTITGNATPVITATSIADAQKNAAVSLIVPGAPAIDPTILFPANVGASWGAAIAVVGGETPFSWSLASGTLPAGITLGASQSSSVVLSGTPTETGAYGFQVKVTDNKSRTALVDLALTVNPAATCLLNGRFAMLYTGFAGGRPQSRAASFTVANDGTISGVMDTRSASAGIEAEALTGSCVTRSGNNGTLTLTGSSTGELIFSYGVRAGLDAGRIQLVNGSTEASGTGLITRQDAAAFDLAHLPVNAAFGTIGTDDGDASMGLAGRFSRDAAGNVTGRADANATPALQNAALSGMMAAPDAVTGRGTLALDIGGKRYPFVYYVLGPERLLLLNMDSAAAAQQLAGFLTPQGGIFDATALAAPGILSLWGAASGTTPTAVLALARLSNADSDAGKLDLLLDTANRSTAVANVGVSGASYTVESDGRATLDFSSSGAARSFALYLDATASGYVVEHGSATGNAGLLEAQAPLPPTGTLPGLFVFGSQFPKSAGPMTLAPLITFSGGHINSNYVTGSYALDASTGRGSGSLSAAGGGSSPLVLYVVNPDRVVLLQFGAISKDAVLHWADR
jgi:hypothetical protein